MRKLSLEERRTTFKEVLLGYSEEEAIREASRCLQCKDTPCRTGCPIGIDIPGFIKLIAEGRFEEAGEKLKDENVLPAVCGRVCPFERFCASRCRLGKAGDPVNIRGLKRFVADVVLESKPVVERETTGKSVAVVGSGPAGLTVAFELAKKGHHVVIYEALPEPGGVLFYGIPEFRLPKDVLRKEIAYIKAMGVDIKTGVVVGEDITLNSLLEEHDAVFVGTGAGVPKTLKVPGADLEGIYLANDFLRRLNMARMGYIPRTEAPDVGEKTLVVGGGSTAMDAARSSLRLGSEVTVVYRRSEAEMPASREEIEHAKEEGVNFSFLASPVSFKGVKRVSSMECIRMRLGPPDESGRRRPIPIEGSEFEIPCDTVVIAIGQRPDTRALSGTTGIRVADWGGIIVDDSMRTTLEGVYAGGDVISGGGTVAEAIRDGKKAAESIHRYLVGH